MDSAKPPEPNEDEFGFDGDGDFEDVRPQAKSPDQIDMWELPQSLANLALFDDDPYLNMQATNIGLVDRWLNEMEHGVLQKLVREDRTPPEAMFLSALTQMWLFATYELLRTWRQRARDVLTLVKNSGLHLKIDALEKELGYQHVGRDLRGRQLRKVQENPEMTAKIEKDLRRTHIVFGQLEVLRVAVAKHEVRGRPNMIAFAPGYARIQRTTGSMEYELSNGCAIMGYISRRDIADGIREIDHDGEPQDLEKLAEFDRFMKGIPE